MDKIYCGNGRIVNTKFGELTKISFSKSDINKMVEHMKSENSEWINLVLKEKQSPEQGKPTHYLEVDTWKPDVNAKPDKSSAKVKVEDDDSLPF